MTLGSIMDSVLKNIIINIFIIFVCLVLCDYFLSLLFLCMCVCVEKETQDHHLTFYTELPYHLNAY